MLMKCCSAKMIRLNDTVTEHDTVTEQGKPD